MTQFFELYQSMRDPGMWYVSDPPDVSRWLRSGPAPCESVELRTYKPGTPLDFTNTLRGLPVVSTRLAPVFASQGDAQLSLVPATVDGSAQFWALKTLAYINAVHGQASVYKVWAPGDGRPDRTGEFRLFDRLVLSEAAVPGHTTIFRLHGQWTRLFVRAALAEAILAVHPTGVELEPVEHV